MTLILVLCVSIVSGVICHLIAKRRGLKPVFWGVMGVLFGPLAIPFVFLPGETLKDH
jgi:hypothetical protein